MYIEKMNLRQTPDRKAVVTLVLEAPPSELSEMNMNIQNGKKYVVEFRQARKKKTLDQVAAIWGKISEIADALYASKDEIYEECLRRYGQGMAMRITKAALPDIQKAFRLVDVKQERDEDGTVFVMVYKGLSEMNSAEASRMLEGVLDECAEVGLSREIKQVE